MRGGLCYMFLDFLKPGLLQKKKKKSYLKWYIAELCDLFMSHLYEDQGPEGVV